MRSSPSSLPSIAAIFVLACCVLLPQPAHAEILLVDRVAASRSLVVPARGLSMSQVEARHGSPAVKHAAVGGGHPLRPPITRWSYPGYTVYFERNRVIDSVANRAVAGEIGPMPVR